MSSVPDKKVIVGFILLLIALLSAMAFLTKGGAFLDKEKKYPVLTIICDNYPHNEELKTSWGFSCLIAFGKNNILFDTGGSGPILLSNMKQLGISPKDIDTIVLSHSHWDHVGGLFPFLEMNNNVKIYVPSSFSKGMQNDIRQTGADCLEIDKFSCISDNIYSTGPMGITTIEQALCIRTDKGLIVMTGCAHPGISQMVKKCSDELRSPIMLVIGGFHLRDNNKNEINNVIEDFIGQKVKYAAPCHCTGDKAIQLFKSSYKDKFIRVGVGKVIETGTI